MKLTIQDLTRIYNGLEIITTRELSEEATDIAITLNITIYNSLYIAAARKLKATLYTSDKKLHEASNKIIDSILLRP